MFNIMHVVGSYGGVPFLRDHLGSALGSRPCLGSAPSMAWCKGEHSGRAWLMRVESVGRSVVDDQ